jgi:hypothetical protein
MANIRNITAPNLPNAPAVYSQQHIDQFTNVMRLYFNSVSNSANAPKINGSFYSTVTQTNPVASAVNKMTVNTTVINNGITVSAPGSRVYVTDSGVYNIQFSAQLDKTGGGASAVYIWLMVNGLNIPYSASKVVIDGPNSEVIPAWNFVIIMAAGDYFELAWSSSDTAVTLPVIAASGSVPAVPSVILTVVWVSNIPV